MMRLNNSQIGRLQSSMGLSGSIPEDAVSFSFKLLDNEFALLENNLKVAAETITYTVARAIAYCAVDLLAKAQPRVPLDPNTWGGKLRRSGTVSFMFGWSGSSGYAVDIAKGKKDGSIDVDMGKMKGRLSRTKQVKRLDAIVHYFRENEFGENIALWAHENLRPYEDRSAKRPNDELYFARTPDTGPKYMEIPWLQSVDDYTKIIKNAVVKDSVRNIGRISSTMAAKRGKYTVNLVRLHRNRISTLGYWR